MSSLPTSPIPSISREEDLSSSLTGSTLAHVLAQSQFSKGESVLRLRERLAALSHTTVNMDLDSSEDEEYCGDQAGNTSSSPDDTSPASI
jgi:hypothetical protein